jgi:Ca2+-binding RTX toxin-like protein
MTTKNGTSGDDGLQGTTGSDTLNGLDGSDLLYGDAGDDALNGGNGIDDLEGGAGNDTLDGGADFDFASYVVATSAVTVSLAVSGPQNTGGGGTDTLIAIEGLIGSDFNDTLTGDGGNNILDGGGGRDVLHGASGNDIVQVSAAADFDAAETFDGGDGYDSLIINAGPVDLSHCTVVGLEELHTHDWRISLTADQLDQFAVVDTGDSEITITAAGIADLTAATIMTNSFRLAVGGVRLVLDQTANGYAITGSSGKDSVVTGSGDDGITLFTGDDKANAGAGNDIVDGQGGDDTLHGGDGDDQLKGSSGNDDISGDAGRDTIAGGNGDDKIDGGAGTDFLRGSAGNDIVHGGLDDDEIEGGGGSNTLYGDGGNDLLVSGGSTKAHAELFGGHGNDQLNGGSGFSVLHGDAGDDDLRGHGGKTVCKGGDGNDTLSSNGRSTRFEGGAGDDKIYLGSGIDHVLGGAGDDIVFVSDRIDAGDTIDGGKGSDGLEYAMPGTLDISTAGNLNVEGIIATGVLITAPQLSQFRFIHADTVEISGGGEARLRHMLDLPKTFILDTATGLDIRSYVGDKITINGSDGNDTVFGSDGSDEIIGAGGHDVLNGGAGDDYVWDDSSGKDTLSGGDGDDLISGTAGDIISGGAGDDQTAMGTIKGVHYDGGEGTDRISTEDGNFLHTDIAGLEEVVLNGSVLKITAGLLSSLTFVEAHDIKIAGGGTIDLSNSVLHAYQMTLSDESTTLILPETTDLNHGLTVFGQDGDDTITGGAAAETIWGGDGDNVLSGGDGDDILHAGGGINTLSGGDGNDALYVNASQVTTTPVDGGDGEDELYIPFSGDTIVLEDIPMASIEKMECFANAYCKAETLLGLHVFVGRDLHLTTGGTIDLTETLFVANNLFLNDDGTTLTLPMQSGIGSFSVTGGASKDVISGGDPLTQFYLNGGGGNDVIDQTSSKFTGFLEGGDGNDVLIGGADGDRLTGGAGIDKMTGHGGGDVFAFEPGDVGATLDTADRITDFRLAQQDLMDLSDIDADSATPGSTFTFIGNAAFGNHAGELRYEFDGPSKTYVIGDSDGDGVGDLFIRLDGNVALTADSFFL